MRDHIKSNARQGDVEDQWRLDHPPSLPVHAAHVWRWFLDLSQTRGEGAFGPARLTRHDIHAWERDETVRLEPWERRAILDLDAAWLASLPKPEIPKGE